MIEYYESVFKPIKLLLWTSGIRLSKNHVRPLIFSSITFQAIVTTMATTSFLYDQSFIDIIDIMVTEFINIYSILRLTTLIYFEKELQQIFKDLEQIWPIIDSKLFKVLKNLKNFQYFIIIELGILNVALCLHGFITGERALHLYKPEIVPEGLFVFFFIDIYYFFLASSGVGFDLFFLSLTIILTVQYKNLNATLRSCIWDGAQQQHFVQKFMKHSELLKGIIERINKIFGPMLFIYMWVMVIVIGILMYIIYERNENPLDFLKYFIILFATIGEMFICFVVPAQLLTNEVELMFTEIYCTDWYGCSVPVKKSLSMMLTTRKTDAVITAAGKLVKMNFEACTSMFKTCFSVFTFLVHMRSFRSTDDE